MKGSEIEVHSCGILSCAFSHVCEKSPRKCTLLQKRIIRANFGQDGQLFIRKVFKLNRTGVVIHAKVFNLLTTFLSIPYSENGSILNEICPPSL